MSDRSLADTAMFVSASSTATHEEYVNEACALNMAFSTTRLLNQAAVKVIVFIVGESINVRIVALRFQSLGAWAIYTIACADRHCAMSKILHYLKEVDTRNL